MTLDRTDDRTGSAVLLLGPVELVANGRTVDLGGQRQRIALATLALNANRPTSAEQLTDAIWGTAPPSTARTQIQICISALRRIMTAENLPASITTRAAGYALELPSESVDVNVFMQELQVAHAEIDNGRHEKAVLTLRRALRLWRGEPLAGVNSSALERTAVSLDDRRRATIEQWAQLELSLGRHDEIYPELRALVDQYPLHERLHGYLMIALCRSGRRAEALQVFRNARTTLIEELGLEPGEELRAIHQDVLRSEPSLEPPGERRPSVDIAAPVPRQLPASIGDFTDREDTVAEIKDFLHERLGSTGNRYAMPLVAISGAGGMGKSTSAIRIAHELTDVFPDGQLYSSVRHRLGTDRVPAVLAGFLRALGFSGSAMPDDAQERAQMFRTRLAGKRMLVVLDDIDGVDDIELLLPGSPGCATILTSRARPTSLPGIYGVDIGGLNPPNSRELLAKMVGEQRLRTESDATTELVRLCGGVPLALRIAGARLASRPHWRVATLVDRLSDDARVLDELSHQGHDIRSQIASTYHGLAPQARRLFRLLSLLQAPDFPGWVAAALLDAEQAEADRAREELAEARLLEVVVNTRTGQARYRFHDLIRAYAREVLREHESTTPQMQRDAIERALSGWLAMAARAHRAEDGGDYTILHSAVAGWRPPEETIVDLVEAGQPIEWLDTERHALVAGVRQAAEQGLDDLCWDLAFTAMTLFEIKGYFDEWSETSEVAVDATRLAGNPRGSAAAAYTSGVLQLFKGRLDDANVLFDTAIAGFRSVNDAHGLALALRNQAYIDGHQGRSAAMAEKYQTALEILHEVDDRMGIAHALGHFAMFRMDAGDLGRAREMLEVAKHLCARAGAARSEAQMLYRFAHWYIVSGEMATARRMLEQVLEIVHRLDDRIGQLHALYGLSLVQIREGELPQAEDTCRAALDRAERLGEWLIRGKLELALGEIALARNETAAAAAYLSRANQTFGVAGSATWQARVHKRLADTAPEN